MHMASSEQSQTKSNAEASQDKQSCVCVAVTHLSVFSGLNYVCHAVA